METEEKKCVSEMQECEKKEADSHVENVLEHAETSGDAEVHDVEKKGGADDVPASVKEDGAEEKCVCRYHEPTTGQKVTAGIILGLAAVGSYTVIHKVSTLFDDD